MAASVYAQFSSRSRTMLTAGCVVIAAGAALTFALSPVAGFVTSLATLIVGFLLLVASMLVRRHDLRYAMASWFYREYNTILSSDSMQHGVNLSPHGLFGDWHFVVTQQDEDQFWTVAREGRGHVLRKTNTLPAAGGVR